MTFKIHGKKVPRGSRDYFSIKVAPMLNGSDLSIPVHVVHGEKEGPVMGLFANIHGSEYYQNRVLRRLVEDIEPSELKGTIVAVPVANPYAFQHMSRQTPNPPEETVDFANMNRVFPGKRNTPLFGSMVSTDISLTMRMAALLSDEVIPLCTHIMDYHGQMRGMALKKMLFNLDEKSKVMAKVFGLGVLHDPPGSISAGSFMPMTRYAGKLGIPSIVPEIGGGGHGEPFEKECENMAVKGSINVMKHLDMLEGEPDVPEKQFYFVKAPHVRSTVGGYFVTDMVAGDVGVGKEPREVTEGEVLGTVNSPYSFKELEQIKAPCDGLIYACRVSGLVEAQSEVLAVADYDGSKWI
ncbi:MAG: succinylglutamate desuccinylase/aspartoacylase family protein [Candidatus Bathyarchaeota archaeon]|nr:succinylglutamate desuccinylase/aspartoacylase family protein [Candidatus Bathyarchaeota archaeon]